MVETALVCWEVGRESDSLNTLKNSTKIYCMSSHFLGIIRMERESVERLGLMD